MADSDGITMTDVEVEDLYGRRSSRTVPKGFDPTTNLEEIAKLRQQLGQGWPVHIPHADDGVDVEGLARMAWARQAAGLDLNEHEAKALERYPTAQPVVDAGQLEPVAFTCPRCGSVSKERFYGPCGECRSQLRSSQKRDR